MCVYRPGKAESTLNLGLGIGYYYNKAIDKGLNLTEAKEVRLKNQILDHWCNDAWRLETQWNESGIVMDDSHVPYLVNEQRKFLDSAVLGI